MAYKQISPVPIVEGGTNATAMATEDGVVYFDGTRLVTSAAGTNAQVLTSNGAGVAPTFQNAGASGGSISIFGSGGESNPSSGYYPLAIGSPPTPTFLSFFVQSSLLSEFSSSATYNYSAQLAVSGTAKNLYVQVYSNASTINVTVTVYKNGSPSALTITIPALTTGTFSDTTHTVAFTAATDTIFTRASVAATSQIFGTFSFVYAT